MEMRALWGAPHVAAAVLMLALAGCAGMAQAPQPPAPVIHAGASDERAGYVPLHARPEPLSIAWIAEVLRQPPAAANGMGAASRGPAERFRAARALLERPGASAEDAAQAQELLKGLDGLAADPAAAQVIRLMQRAARQTVELSQTRADLAKANKSVADLQDKIEQIKNLEVKLQQPVTRGGPTAK